MTTYREWQQLVDGPDEETQEDQISDAMAELLVTYKTVPALAEALGVRTIDVRQALHNGIASDNLIAAINRLQNEGQP